MKLKINKSLSEDTLADVIDDFGEQTAKAAKEAEAKLNSSTKIRIESDPELDNIQAKGDVEQALSKALAQAREIQDQIEGAEAEAKAQDEEAFVDPHEFGFANNILICGPAGTGKTARIKAWCKANNITLVYKDAKTMDPSDLGGIISRQVDDAGKQLNTATKLTNTEFDQLDTPDTVLFLDELNRAPTDVAGSLLTLIQDHAVTDHSSPTGYRILKGFLFTIAAVNPASGEYDVETLDMAMKTRFGQTNTEYDNKQQLAYLYKKFSRIANSEYQKPEVRKKAFDRYNLAKRLLTDSRFHFDTADEEAELSGSDMPALNYRSFTNLLTYCDGTKESLLDNWSKFCNPQKYEVVEEILNDYFDVDWDDLADDAQFSDKNDKANSVFNENPFAQKQESAWDKLQKSGLF